MMEPPGPPTADPAQSDHNCGTGGCNRRDELWIVRPGNGYEYVLCRRHAARFLRVCEETA